MATNRNFVQQAMTKVLTCRKCGQPLKRGEDRYCKSCVREIHAYHGVYAK